jgi:selenocysteine lyase/cysteine desulfurase
MGAAAPLAACVRAAKSGPAQDEWTRIRAQFDLEPGVINLDNGWTCTAPRAVYDVYEQHARMINRCPAHQLSEMARTKVAPTVKPALAKKLGVPVEQLAFARNTTEAIGAVLLGYPFAAGDELVCGNLDYYHMLDMVDARAASGVTVKRADVPTPAPSEQAIVDAYANVITPKTKLVLVTQVSNRSGQIMPVAKIAELAHRVGAEVVCDGAQAFAFLPDTIPELGADYYCTSLHKWLMSPVASGLLWMKPEHTTKIPARFGKRFPDSPPMGPYEDVGTVCSAQFVAIGAALAFHDQIGPPRITARIRELVAYLRKQLSTIRGIKFYTVDEAWASAGLLTFELPGHAPHELQQRLWDDHKVLTQWQMPETAPTIRGIRVSPAVYTTFDEIDRAVDAIRRVA